MELSPARSDRAPGPLLQSQPGLRADALGLGESVIMGVAGSGPAYSVAASTAVLIAAVGVRAPACLLYCGLIMFGVVFAFRHLNRQETNAGATYAWAARIFSPALGFFTGWSVVISSILFMVSGTLPAATGTLQLVAPALVDNQGAVTVVAAGWLVAIGAIVAKGIKLTSYTQIMFTLVEAGVLALLIALAALGFAHAPARAVGLDWFTGAGFTPSLFASGALTALFAWPLLGAGFCIFVALYGVPTFDLTTNLIGTGTIAIGVVPYLWNRARARSYAGTAASSR